MVLEILLFKVSIISGEVIYGKRVYNPQSLQNYFTTKKEVPWRVDSNKSRKYGCGQNSYWRFNLRIGLVTVTDSSDKNVKPKSEIKLENDHDANDLVHGIWCEVRNGINKY